MMAWDHGYHSSSVYTSGYYRELAPNWIDFASLVSGHEPPRPSEGEAFHYLDLGSGMGLGLCLLAALYPEGQFVGVDFHPDHIAHSQWLANKLALDNISFLEADFIDLARDSTPLGVPHGKEGIFHYVVAHGIATWVTRDVQQALLGVSSNALRSGGLLYLSYNTYPGWLSLSCFQQLVTLESRRLDPQQPEAPLTRARAHLDTLIDPNRSASPIGQVLPSLAADLQNLGQQDTRYLSQEYNNAGWAPLFAAQMHQRCEEHKLRYQATATLPELFEGLLHESLHPLVLSESDPLIRQALMDLATNKGFRRDLFVKGRIQLTPQQHQNRLAEIQVRLQEAPIRDHYQFNTIFGDVTGDTKVYRALEKALVDAPQSIGDLASRCELPLPDVVQACAMLLHANRVGLDRSHSLASCEQACERTNLLLLDLILTGSPYAALTAPGIGTAVGVNTIEAMIAHGLRAGLQDSVLALCVQAGLANLDCQIRDGKGQLITEPRQQLEALASFSNTFQSERLPWLEALGTLPST